MLFTCMASNFFFLCKILKSHNKIVPIRFDHLNRIEIYAHGNQKHLFTAIKFRTNFLFVC